MAGEESEQPPQVVTDPFLQDEQTFATSELADILLAVTVASVVGQSLSALGGCVLVAAGSSCEERDQAVRKSVNQCHVHMEDSRQY